MHEKGKNKQGKHNINAFLVSILLTHQVTFGGKASVLTVQ